MSRANEQSFAPRLLHWFDQHGRSGLPWQSPRSAYRVWLSEVMLQQTQVAAVVPYFNRFIARFPTVQALAEASSDEVMLHWAGLGYYARARNLHATAQKVMAERGGGFPMDLEGMQALPGVGRSTAAAILAQAHGLRHAILDGNVKRVLARWAGIDGYPGETAVARQLWQVSEAVLPQARLADYTQALMDLGATLCTARKPACERCPLAADCVALGQARTHELPTRKPARQRPLRKAWLLLINNEEGEWLVERRPPVGIWGGLWCPPVFAVEAPWQAELAERHGLAMRSVEVGASFSHAFTHFELQLTPLRGSAVPLANAVHDRLLNSRWLQRQALRNGELALPAPITQFLQDDGSVSADR